MIQKMIYKMFLFKTTSYKEYIKMHTYFVESKEEMINIGSDKHKIGCFVKLNNEVYKFVNISESINNNMELKEKNFTLNFTANNKNSIFTLWEDNNGFHFVTLLHD